MDMNFRVTRSTAKLNALIALNSDCKETIGELKSMTYDEIEQEYKSVFNTGMTPGEIRYFHQRPYLGVSLKGISVPKGWLK